MSKPLSTSVTFEALVARVATMEAGTFSNSIVAPGLMVSGVITDGDGNFGLSFNAGTPYIAFDSGDHLGFDRLNNALSLTIGGSTKTSINSSGSMNLHGSISIGNDPNWNLDLLSGNPRITFDANDYINYDRAANSFIWFIGGAQKAALDASGFVHNVAFAAPIVGTTDGTIYMQTVAGERVFTFGGAVMRYNSGSGKIIFSIGGTDVASIDASGNMRLKGTLTQSTTP